MAANISIEQALLLISEFDGYNIPVYQFLKECDEAIEILDSILHKTLIIFIKNLKLKGKAKDFMRWNSFTTYDQFRTTLKSIFYSTETECQLLGNLGSMYQQDQENVTEFITQLDALRFKIIEVWSLENNPTLEKVEIYRKQIDSHFSQSFLHGLKSEISMQLHLHNKTFDEMKLPAIAIEKHLKIKMNLRESNRLSGEQNKPIENFGHKKDYYKKAECLNKDTISNIITSGSTKPIQEKENNSLIFDRSKINIILSELNKKRKEQQQMTYNNCKIEKRLSINTDANFTDPYQNKPKRNILQNWRHKENIVELNDCLVNKNLDKSKFNLRNPHKNIKIITPKEKEEMRSEQENNSINEKPVDKILNKIAINFKNSNDRMNDNIQSLIKLLQKNARSFDHIKMNKSFKHTTKPPYICLSDINRLCMLQQPIIEGSENVHMNQY